MMKKKMSSEFITIIQSFQLSSLLSPSLPWSSDDVKKHSLMCAHITVTITIIMMTTWIIGIDDDDDDDYDDDDYDDDDVNDEEGK